MISVALLHGTYVSGCVHIAKKQLVKFGITILSTSLKSSLFCYEMSDLDCLLSDDFLEVETSV